MEQMSWRSGCLLRQIMQVHLSRVVALVLEREEEEEGESGCGSAAGGVMSVWLRAERIELVAEKVRSPRALLAGGGADDVVAAAGVAVDECLRALRMMPSGCGKVFGCYCGWQMGAGAFVARK